MNSPGLLVKFPSQEVPTIYKVDEKILKYLNDDLVHGRPLVFNSINTNTTIYINVNQVEYIKIIRQGDSQ